jgi:hypothetical protein
MKFPEMNSQFTELFHKVPKKLTAKRACSLKFPKTELTVKRIVPRSSQKLNSQNVSMLVSNLRSQKKIRS